MSESSEQSGGEVTQQYKVEVGVTRTGVIPVEAESEEEAREKAKDCAEAYPEDLNFAESFTNNVRGGGD